MEPPSETQKNAPSVATAFDADSGEEKFQFVQDGSHINFISTGQDAMYLSARSEGTLQKINIETLEIEWTLGGPSSDFVITNFQGQTFHPEELQGEDAGSWRHQHKFQHLDDSHFSLFDNHVLEDRSFANGESSRMVILKVDQEARTAEEIFSFDTGDQAVVYGGADVLPSGNVIGCSYPDFVFPEIPDLSYHQNIWEVTQDGDIAWRASFKGPNPKNVFDTTSPFSHRISACDEPPIGWVIYNVERFYEKPLISKPCKMGGSIFFKAYNTIRTQNDRPGFIYLIDHTESWEVISKTSFSFQKSWLQEAIEVEVPADIQNQRELTLKVVNEWEDVSLVSVGLFNALASCDNAGVSMITMIADMDGYLDETFDYESGMYAGADVAIESVSNSQPNEVLTSAVVKSNRQVPSYPIVKSNGCVVEIILGEEVEFC